jgi:hypothetical protein
MPSSDRWVESEFDRSLPFGELVKKVIFSHEWHRCFRRNVKRSFLLPCGYARVWISDAALETAAGTARAGNYTLFFCTALESSRLSA